MGQRRKGHGIAVVTNLPGPAHLPSTRISKKFCASMRLNGASLRVRAVRAPGCCRAAQNQCYPSPACASARERICLHRKPLPLVGLGSSRGAQSLPGAPAIGSRAGRGRVKRNCTVSASLLPHQSASVRATWTALVHPPVLASIQKKEQYAARLRLWPMAPGRWAWDLGLET